MAKAKRTLALVSPMPKGADVESLQKAINSKYHHFKIDHRVEVDGEFGRQTLLAAKQVMTMMGAGPNNRRAVKKGRVTKNAQRLIRGRKKTRREKLAAKARKPYRRKLRKRYKADPGKLALAWAKQQIGVTESPAGSNRGPRIDTWTGYWGGVAWQWCGTFAGYAVKKIAGAKVTSWLPYAPSITADAKAHRNGLKAVPYDQARAGDLATFWNGQHIGLVDHVDSQGRLHTVEGNTSSGTAGSQSNGGGVFARVRSRSDVDVIARPDYR